MTRKADDGGVGIDVIHVSYTANNLKSEFYFKLWPSFVLILVSWI